ncbi:DegT/DnrJ/EryC1/StrS aminotransferase family protein [Streptomyces sp. V1I1]|uniref:DegT/DnrJ/EryC1/StrS family aminotransferase n=1 Tax=Streptomyces sp. V1I1 TaxID=3042272 RepID=UPI002786B7C5|nr:DegT/DnrJ/EryC1/StrS family aminotransferase [Streptomyces sp. V1I1]MDQ0940796.1 dTDP-4-amino-4,6-dideoxygalactose transaminase [Streptomyces sp. V1I1]
MTPVRTEGWPQWPPPAGEEQRERLLRVLESGEWGATAGSETESFAAAFAESVGASYGVCTVNGTVALFLALRALGVRPGDEVIVPAYTFVASATAVVLTGARPVVADVLSETLHLDPAAARRLVGPRTRAVMPVHLAGAPADTEALRSWGIPVVEDAAQAHGARRHGRAAGSLGVAGCFSFQSSKAMTAGEGGIVVTDDRRTYERLWSLHNVGRRRDGGWYEHPELGWNLRMTEFQAAVLHPQLSMLEQQLAHRAARAATLEAALEEVEGLDLIGPPAGTTRHTWHLAMLRYAPAAFGGHPKAALLEAMTAQGIPLDAGYRSLSRERCTGGGPCPVAEAAEDTVVWVRQPMLMADDAAMADIARAALLVQQAFRQRPFSR